jgi:uncharacterized protein YjiS (DUF1127 family)
MATIDIAGRMHAAGRLEDIARAGLRAWLRRRAERRALAEISHLDPHLIRDIGLDPERVQAATGGWEVLPVNRALLAKDAHA